MRIPPTSTTTTTVLGNISIIFAPPAALPPLPPALQMKLKQLAVSRSLLLQGTNSPHTPATSPPTPDPATILTALLTITPLPPPPILDDMADLNPKLFKGDGIGENVTDFLNSIRRRNLLSPTWADDQKIEFFELSLKSGSYAKSWFNKLKATEKDTFKNLAAAFQKQWPEKEMAEKEKGELEEELLALAAKLASRFEDGGRLIPQVLKNIPDSLLLRLGPKHTTWAELIQTVKDVPATDIASIH
ncbi:hypothetical protein B0H10DRAFT_2239930 [Mycena sp. CBHHK59/15]|nr:hypothetical protein B0H10DRAFT_2239930 [Mycena sp. CBHHK59/15]